MYMYKGRGSPPVRRAPDAAPPLHCPAPNAKAFDLYLFI
jgi:hypothetical protein